MTGSIIPVAATTLKAAENAALDRKATIGAMLLDTTLDKDNARALCARLRQSGARMPIILLSASQDESDIVQGLEAGADDYVFKPPQPAELAARVRALMRAYGDNVQAPLRIGPQDFLPAVRILRHRRTQRITHLTAKEAALLQFLHMVRGDLVARTTLEREIWGYSPGVRTNTVVTHVHRLRTKIELDPAHPTFLLRERGFYRFCVDEPEIRQSASVNTAILDDPWHKSSAGAPPAEEWIGVAKQCA